MMTMKAFTWQSLSLLRKKCLLLVETLFRAQESPDMYSVLVQIFAVVEIESLMIYTAEFSH